MANAEGLNYIPTGVEQIFSKYNKYYQDKGAEDLIRSSVVSGRRTSDVAPEAISKFNTEYGLGASKGMADLSMQGAQQAQNEAMTWGGTSAFTGNTLMGQNPFASSEALKDRSWRSEESAIQREYNKNMKEAEWQANKEIADKQAASNIWAGIFGGAGSLFGGWLGRH